MTFTYPAVITPHKDMMVSISYSRTWSSVKETARIWRMLWMTQEKQLITG